MAGSWGAGDVNQRLQQPPKNRRERVGPATVLEYLASYRVASSGSKRVRQRIIEVANSRRLGNGRGLAR
jgi:hypothetical protein